MNYWPCVAGPVAGNGARASIFLAGLRVWQGLRKSSHRASSTETRVSQDTRGGNGRMGDDGTPFNSKI